MTGEHVNRHHPDIQRVLDILSRAAPAPVERASAVLHRLLHDVYTSPCPDYAWHASGLTGDGFPLEFTFTSADAVIRYTADPAASALVARERLSGALALLQRLGEPPVEAETERALRALQAEAAGPEGGSGLYYGAWVGGRHNGSSATGDRFKLYVEVPKGVNRDRPWLPPVSPLEPIPQLSDRVLQPRIYGYEPATGTQECYFRVAHMMSCHLYHLLRQAGLGHRTRELLDLLLEAYGHPLNDKIPGGSAGFSYSLAPDRPVTCTLFLFARALWGGDRRIRSRMAVLAEAHGWELGAYRQVTAPLVERNVYQTYHGLVGLVVTPSNPISITIGLRPPPLGEGP